MMTDQSELKSRPILSGVTIEEEDEDEKSSKSKVSPKNLNN